MSEKFLTYRGDLKALAASGSLLLFVTAHDEGHSTALFRLDADELTLSSEPLPTGANALLIVDQTVWIAGTDRRLYRTPLKGNPTAIGEPLPAIPTALAKLSDHRLAVLAGTHVVTVRDGVPTQTLELSARGTAIATDPTGQWLVVGMRDGTVSVYEAETQPTFTLSDSAKLHEDGVSAILFETDDLRFLSASADNKLFTTHARGRLEAEDRGRSFNHTERVTSLIWSTGDRFLTGSRDGTVKAWPRVGNKQPSTLKDGCHKVTAMTVVTVHNQQRLAVGCTDDSIRFFPLDEEGKPGELLHRVNGFQALARVELAAPEVQRREAALKSLAEAADAPSIERIMTTAEKDDNFDVRRMAAELLAASKHPRAPKHLEWFIGHKDEKVRIIAFQGLRAIRGPADLRPIELALKTDKADVGQLAIAALEPLANTDDQAMATLIGATDRNPTEVRRAALSTLERVHPSDSPEASLVALASKHKDLRQLALLRLHQRHLLDQSRVQSALRRHTEDENADVRRTAYLLSLHTRPKLLAALTSADEELARQLTELESIESATPSTGTASTQQSATPTVNEDSELTAGRILSFPVVQAAIPSPDERAKLISPLVGVLYAIRTGSFANARWLVEQLPNQVLQEFMQAIIARREAAQSGGAS